MEYVKLEKAEPAEASELESMDAKTPEETTSSTAERDATALAGYVRLPLDAIDDWSYQENHTWLKCMLMKHTNFQLMEESQSVVTSCKLIAIDSVMRDTPCLSIDSILDVVEMKLDCHIAEKLRGELRVWRQAARNESLSSGSPWRARSRHSGCGGGGSGCGGCGDLLWQHILRLLMTRDPAVRWLEPQLGRFQFVRSCAAARSWGRTKNNESMSFEKMSRSIRQYYRQKSGVIQKVSNKARLQYQFNMLHPDVVRFIVQNFPAREDAVSGPDAELRKSG